MEKHRELWKIIPVTPSYLEHYWISVQYNGDILSKHNYHISELYVSAGQFGDVALPRNSEEKNHSEE